MSDSCPFPYPVFYTAIKFRRVCLDQLSRQRIPIELR